MRGFRPSIHRPPGAEVQGAARWGCASLQPWGLHPAGWPHQEKFEGINQEVRSGEAGGLGFGETWRFSASAPLLLPPPGLPLRNPLAGGRKEAAGARLWLGAWRVE